MKPFEINYYIAKAKSSQTEIAEGLNVYPQSVSRVINGRTNSKKIASRISEVSGVPLNQLFPDGRYSDDHLQAA